MEAHDGNAYQNQAEMIYNGSGQRLALTAFAAGQTLTTTYVLDGNNLLAATAEGQTIYYLQGRAIIGEVKQTWSFNLADGLGSVRQVTDIQGQVTLSRSFTPWGELLDQTGAGDATWGYLGGVLDAATGLIYVGNGQYYDPTTGRFLSRGVNPGAVNPYVPWQGDPLGMLIGPLALVAVFGSKRKNGKGAQFLVLMLVVLTFGVTLSACGTGIGYQDNPSTPTVPPSTPTSSVTPTQGGGDGTSTSTQTPGNTLTSTPSCTPTSTAAPNVMYMGLFNLSVYYIPHESEFTGNLVNIPAHDDYWIFGHYLSKDGPNHYTDVSTNILQAKRDFLYKSDSVCMQGSGRLTDGSRISCVTPVDWVGEATEDRVQGKVDPDTNEVIIPPIQFSWPEPRELVGMKTAARCATGILSEGDELVIPEITSFLLEGGGDGVLKVTDTGEALCYPNETIDIFGGEGKAGLTQYNYLMQRTDQNVIPEYVEVYKRIK